MREFAMIAAVLTIGAAPLAAQTPARCEGNARPVPDLGISLACSNCSVGPFGSPDAWSFQQEPRVSAVQRDGPASSALRAGDEIVRVNGSPITSPAGAAALGGPQVGRVMVLTVRRGGSLEVVQLTPRGVCPEAVRSTAVVGAGARRNEVVPVTQPAGWLGLSFSCDNCTGRTLASDAIEWHFESPPTVYTLDTSSPAYRAGLRRGDVITHVDGIDVRQREAGYRLAHVRPGEVVRLTYRRDGRSRQASVRATQPFNAPRIAQNRSNAEEDLRRALETQERLQAAARQLGNGQQQRAQDDLLRRLEQDAVRQQRELTALQSRLRAERGAEARRALEQQLHELRQQRAREQQMLINELVARQQEELRSMQELQRELARGGTFRLGSAGGTVRAAPHGAVSPDVRESRRMLWSGVLGTTDVEVLGGSPALVQQDGEEITITIGGTVVKLTQRRRE